jgi:excinuclease ABC subunit C
MQREELKKLDVPDVPGVYLFTQGKGKSKKILYVGKASSLRDRVRSYFDDDLIVTRGPRLVDMVTQATGLIYESTPTVLEALVREAALIREYTPPANSMGKDDKTFLYAVITDEEVPRVLAIRGKDIDFKSGFSGMLKLKAIHGPFPSGYQLREALKLIRKIFPFYDTPRPIIAETDRLGRRVAGGNKHLQANVEFNRQIGQYPRDMDRAEYMKSIRNVSLFLSGKVKMLRTTLGKDMKVAIQKEAFEDAGAIKRQLYALDHVQDVSLIKEENTRDETGPRIEAYDTAHISGTNAIGVMVVIENGSPVKADYRTFRIRGAHNGRLMKSTIRQNNDIGSLREILTRRFGHSEWDYPRAIVVDGGKVHKKAAEDLMKEFGLAIPVAAVVKDEKHRPREVLGGARAHITDSDAVLANAEAHRFSLLKHRQARSRALRVKGD